MGCVMTLRLVVPWALGTQRRRPGPVPKLLSVQELDSHLNKDIEASG